MSKYMVNPAFRVHEQDGNMTRALRGKMVKDNRAGAGLKYKIDFNLAIAPHAKYVIMGTKVMLPRDVLWTTASAPATIHLLRTDIIRTLGKVMRTQSLVRFNGGRDSLSFTLMNFRKTKKELRIAGNRAVESAGELLKSLILEHISLKDYTLADLRAMDHPYATRHGSIQIHNK